MISHCVRYLACTKIGAIPEPQHCLTGEHFDLKKRLCLDKEEAECDSDKVCPDDQTEYSMDNGDLICYDGVPVPKNETQVVEAPKKREEDDLPDPNEEVLPMVKRGMQEVVANSQTWGDYEWVTEDEPTDKNSEGMANGELKLKDLEKIEVTNSPIIEGIIIGVPKSKSVEGINGTNVPFIEGMITGMNSEDPEGNAAVRIAKSIDGNNSSSFKGNYTLIDSTVIEADGLFNLTGNKEGAVQNSKRSANAEGPKNKNTVINIMVAVASGDGDIGLPRPGTKKKAPQIVHVKVNQMENGNRQITGINETLARQIGKQLTEVLQRFDNNNNQQGKNGAKLNAKQQAQLEAKLKDGKGKNGNNSLGAGSNMSTGLGSKGGAGPDPGQQQQLQNLMRDKSKGQVSEVKVIQMEDGKEKTRKMNESVINQVGAQLLVVALNEGKASHQHGVLPNTLMRNKTYTSEEETWDHGIPQNPVKFNKTNGKSQGTPIAGHHIRHNF